MTPRLSEEELAEIERKQLVASDECNLAEEVRPAGGQAHKTDA